MEGNIFLGSLKLILVVIVVLSGWLLLWLLTLFIDSIVRLCVRCRESSTRLESRNGRSQQLVNRIHDGGKGED